MNENVGRAQLAIWLVLLSFLLILSLCLSPQDVKDEIFDMVKPSDRNLITLKDLVDCKVGDTVVGMLSDMLAFWQYDRREQFMDHGSHEES